MYLIEILNGMIILVDRLRIKQLIAKFSKVKSISRNELKEFYEMYDPELKETTFRWMIYDLKKQKIMVAIDRGLYSLVLNNNSTYFNSNIMLVKKEYKPLVSKNLGKLYSVLKKQFPFLNICIWETSWLNEFMLHQPGKFISIIEVENGAEETVFYHLKANYNNVFIKPNLQELEWYIYNNSSSIVVKRLVSQAPLSDNKHIVTPKLEKILIDVFVEKDFFYPYQGQELINIYKYIFQYYQISLKSLVRYAERRKCKGPLKEYMQKLHFDIDGMGVF